MCPNIAWKVLNETTEATRPWSSSPLIISCLLPSLEGELPDGRIGYTMQLMSLSRFFYIIFLSQNICVHLFLSSLRVDGCWYLFSIRSFIYKRWNVSSIDCTTVAGIGWVRPVNQLTILFGFVKLNQLTLLSRSEIIA